QEALEAGELRAQALVPLADKQVIPAGSTGLARPDELFFADAPEIAARFSALDAHLVPPEHPQAAAWAHAGVRPLSAAVTVAALAPGEGEPAPTLQARLLQRMPLIRRVARGEGAPEDALGFLNAIRIVNVEKLQQEYRLALGEDMRRSAPEPVQALLVLGEGVLYVEGRVPPPWLPIARELAREIAQTMARGPGRAQPVGGMTLAIREVLVAESPTAAEETLDALGYPD
ncbi:MAG: hypothetical protein R3272_11550, partial [Candidatus Promineifilaceae bacterium]|nr:hypothetical protein [Candidatus Promineifilaceae bacterium]